MQEVRKLRADAANANLAVDKVTLEKENLSKIVDEHKLKEEDMERKLRELEEKWWLQGDIEAVKRSIVAQ